MTYGENVNALVAFHRAHPAPQPNVDTIRDMLSVGEYGDGWAIWRWDVYDSRLVATFPREDEAWGVTSLILEYVERYGHDIDRAIWTAMQEYHEAVAHSAACALDNEPTPTDAAYQDHAHAMEAYPN